MAIDLSTNAFDRKVRYYVYDRTMKEGAPPTVAETAIAQFVLEEGNYSILCVTFGSVNGHRIRPLSNFAGWK